jgi:arsenate reductase (glutaredoxin)
MVYKALRLAERDLTDDEIVDVMVKNPDLIQRPIVEKGARAILAPSSRATQRNPLASRFRLRRSIGVAGAL